MASDKNDKLTKKEEEIVSILNEKGYIQVDDVDTLKKISKKLEKIYGPVDPKLILQS